MVPRRLLTFLAGYGLLMVAAQLPLLPRYLSLTFSLGTWALTFSWAPVASAVLFWIAAEHPHSAQVWSYLVLAAITRAAPPRGGCRGRASNP
jgi:tellurite resistance protein